MAERYGIADLHGGHANINFFSNTDGTQLRPWGRVLAPGETVDDVSPEEKERYREEMDEALITRWNSVVGVADKVEVLGDMVINRRYLPMLDRMNGRKRLVMGNHDIFKIADYAKYFEEMKGSKPIDHMGVRFMLTHIPMHVDSLSRWDCNLHGHLHSGRVMVRRATNSTRRVPILGNRPQRLTSPFTVMETVVDPRYFCVSVEHTDYTPIHFDDIVARIKEQREQYYASAV